MELDTQTLQLDFPISAAAPWSKNSLQEPSSGEFVNQDGPILLKSSQVQLASTCGGGEFVSLDGPITAEIFASLISLNVPGGGNFGAKILHKLSQNRPKFFKNVAKKPTSDRRANTP